MSVEADDCTSDEEDVSTVDDVEKELDAEVVEEGKSEVKDSDVGVAEVDDSVLVVDWLVSDDCDTDVEDAELERSVVEDTESEDTGVEDTGLDGGTSVEDAGADGPEGCDGDASDADEGPPPGPLCGGDPGGLT